ncbi:histidine kinase [Tenacibaculum lutimaris]|uniref:histidine kinase n=1 Tax=Tenacibaculum lutimaris TaxID=285258 RepID=A0A420DYA5_9FLAO|nr:tetratricopeptide repeat-containing sensor histidine kinase [Tenacibaculum lutimaris]RKF02773.1 histidine kinase [Tenacibaculum lutimaris]
MAYKLSIIFIFSFSHLFFYPNESVKEKEEVYFQKDKDSILKSKYNYCYKLYKSEDYAKALQETLKFLEHVKNQEHNEYITSSHILIAKIFSSFNNNEKAIYHFKKALQTIDSKKNIDKLNSINLSFDYAEILLGLGTKYQLIKKIDSAEYFYNKIASINSLNPKIQSIRAKSYNNLAGIYIDKSDFKTAKNYTEKAIEIHQKTNNKVSEASSLNNLASIYLLEKNYLKAKQTYFEGIRLIEKNDNYKAIKFKKDLYLNIAYILYLEKDYKAYDYQEKSYIIKDSLRDKEFRAVMEQIYVQHKVDIQKEKANLIKEQRKLEEAQEAKTSLLFGTLSFLVLIVSGVIIYNYKLRQKNLHLKLSESKLIQQQSIEKLKSEAQIKILNATIDGKETERKLIAEILHDNVSALLSSANMHLTATKKQFNGDTPQEIDKTQAIISEASQKVRDLSHNLVSSILLKFGLEYAIKDVTKKYSNSQLKFEVSAQNINRYNQEFEIKIFNVIQELINNILKHSKAQHAEIILKEEEDQLTVLVKDDGVGFSTSSSSFSDGIGLNQIEARIHIMSGKLTINSKENIGTSIYISVPILKQQKNFKLTSVS